MSLLLIPQFFLSLICIFIAFWRVTNKVRLSLVVFFSLPVLGISYPLVMLMLNSMAGGIVESRYSFLWSTVLFLTIDDGDIYMGAGGFILVQISTIFLIAQFLLIRNNKSAKH